MRECHVLYRIAFYLYSHAVHILTPCILSHPTYSHTLHTTAGAGGGGGGGEGGGGGGGWVGGGGGGAVTGEAQSIIEALRRVAEPLCSRMTNSKQAQDTRKKLQVLCLIDLYTRMYRYIDVYINVYIDVYIDVYVDVYIDVFVDALP